MCKECHVTAHVTCSQSLPKVCGLPKQLADHYKSNLKDVEASDTIGNDQSDSALCEGWIKMVWYVFSVCLMFCCLTLRMYIDHCNVLNYMERQNKLG